MRDSRSEDVMSLALREISYTYPGAERVVLERFILELRRGEVLCLLGASGCGKTTVLKIAASLLVPQSGAVLLDGKRIDRPGPERIVMFQDQEQLFPWKNTLGNVTFALRHGSSGVADRRVLRERGVAALGEVGLQDALGLYPFQLSGGMRQRVALARAFATEPPFLLLDEPFAAVDAPTRERLGELLLQLQGRHGPGVLFVTHDVEEALRLGDRIVVLGREGRVLLEEDLTAVSDHAVSEHQLTTALRSRIRSALTVEG